jgi:hypothetical protein
MKEKGKKYKKGSNRVRRGNKEKKGINTERNKLGGRKKKRREK